MKKIIKELRDKFFSNFATKKDIADLYNQMAGMFQIQNAMRGDIVLRPMRGWAISPDAMNWMLAELQERKTPTVIEFGSGQSTIIFGSVLNRVNGKLFSVEHDLSYLSEIRKQAEACGLSDVITFVHSPLMPVEGDGQSYCLDTLPLSGFDVALIDGPPFVNGLYTRFEPLRWAVQNVNDGGVVYLDDAYRDGEMACLGRLQELFQDIKIVEKSAEKGLIEIRKTDIK